MPARIAPSERDQQLVELSQILNESYTSSGYFLHPSSTAASNGAALSGASALTAAAISAEVDRWSDRFRLQDASRRKQLFDEGSLALRDFPPELGEMADRQTKRRKRLGSCSIS